MIYTETPVIELKSDFLEKTGVSVFIKREDLNHPFISGNKWWKLKFNMEKAHEEGYSTLLTFGGSYSNHLYATSAASNELGFNSIGIVRGEETLPLNPTLSFAKDNGMQLHYVNRDDYRKKTDPEFIQSLHDLFGNFYLIPEGGTNALAIKGSEEWASQLSAIDFDYLCLPVGTGGTMAGMVNVLNDKSIIGFSSLKGGIFLEDNIKAWLKHGIDNWRIETRHHFGGYGKIKKELIEFMAAFEADHNIPLDPVYTGKMMYGVYDMLKQNEFEKGSKILALHTGGLQGRAGFNF